MARQSIPFDGYPAPGAASIKNDWRGVHFGPNNTYQAGGYNMTAQELGMTSIEMAQHADFSQSGNYYIRFTFPLKDGNNETRAIPAPYINVKWYIASNGTEVSNNNAAIGGESVNCWASGL